MFDVDPLAIEAGIMLGAFDEDAYVEAELMSRSFHRYLQGMWSVVEPGVPFVDSWHLGAICDHLQGVSEGHIQQLIINVPPRCLKSITTCVAWPSWEWTWAPQVKWLFTSYAEELSTRDSLKCRQVIDSPWYQARWGRVYQLDPEQCEKTRFSTTKKGVRVATSFGGMGTGEGGNRVVLDDPHNMKFINSDDVREGAINTWKGALSTRRNNPLTDAFVLIMQRGHERDLAGYCLAEELGWEHLCLPMEYEPTRRVWVKGRQVERATVECVTKLGFKDPRTKPGELLQPQRFDAKVVANLKTQLGEYGAAAQLQQRPAPTGGGLIKRHKFRLWPKASKLPVFKFILQSYDTAFTDKTSGDPTACTTWGVFYNNKTKLLDALLLDAWRKHYAYPELRRRAVRDWKLRFGEEESSGRVDAVIVEQQGSGQSLLQDLNAEGVPAIGYKPGRMDKTTRVHSVLPFLDAGRFWVLESQEVEGANVRWAEDFLQELNSFPVAPHDDYVDTWSQAGIYLRDQGLIGAPLSEPSRQKDRELAEDMIRAPIQKHRRRASVYG